MTRKQLLLIVKIVKKGPYPEVERLAQGLMCIYELPRCGASLLERAINVAHKNTFKQTNNTVDKPVEF